MDAGPAITAAPVDPTLALLRALVSRRSVTPEDDGCQALIADALHGLGFRCETIVRNGVTNLWARRGHARPLVCFAGHTDVVPTGPVEKWSSNPFAPTERDGLLYARGTADMKASLAAFVTAIQTFLRAHPDAPGSIALLLTSDEEGPSVDGSVRVVEMLASRGEALDYCVVGEPTSVEALGDAVKNGRRGSLSGTLTVRGVQGHVAYPHLARNPIHLVAPALAELAATEWDCGNEHFPPTSFQCSNIHAGTGATNVIPSELTVLFNFRYSTASTRESLAARIGSILAHHGLDCSIEWTGHGKAYLTARARLVDVACEAVREVTGRTPALSTSGGTSDGRFIADLCSEVVELGPVGASIHKIDECVRIADLSQLSRIYASILEKLLLGTAKP